MSGLPRGWAEAKLGDVVYDIRNGRNVAQDKSGNGTAVSRIETIATEVVDFGRTGFTTDYYREDSDLLKAGDILFSHINSATHLGKTAIFPDTSKRLIHGINLLRVSVAKEATLPKFFHQYCRLLRKKGVFELNGQHAVNQSSINQKRLKELPFSLPPLAEQKRIVAKLDALSAKSARARTELARIETLVSRYKQAVLSKAFSGELTREWRRRSEPKTVADIADRIAKERAAMRSSRGLSREGSNRSVPLHDAYLGVIPATWIWLNFGQCSYELTVGHVGPMKDRYVTTGIPFLRSLNVKENRIDFRNIAFIDDKFHSELKKSALQPGDLVVIRTGEPGVAAVVPHNLETANCSDLVICRLVSSIKPHYAAFYMNSSFARSTVGDMQVGVAQQHFNVGAMSKMPVPVPPLEEQHEIVRRIESAFAKIDRLAKEAKRALELVGRLDEAILAKAFRGELVPQDENDEPAEHLLARIRAEREAAPRTKRGRGAKA